MKYLFLENNNGKVIRAILCDRVPLSAVRRMDTGRFELWTNQTFKTNKDIPVQVLSLIPDVIPAEGLPIPSIGTLKQGEYSKQLQYDVKTDLRGLKYLSFCIQGCFFGFFIFCFISLILQVPVEDTQQIEKEFQVDIVQHKPDTKTLIIENPFKEFEEEKEVAGIQKSNTSLNTKLNKLFAIKNNTQKLKINLGSVFSLEDNLSDESEKVKNKIDQKLYDKSIFSASNTSNKLEGIGGYAKVTEKSQGFGDIALLSDSLSSKGEKIRYKGGLSVQQKEALNAFMSKEEGVLRRCYERGLQVFPEFRGDIYLSWRIDKKGKAQSIRVAKLAMNKNSNINLNEFKECITDHIKLWSFPLILNGEPIQYTFQFKQR